jgi:N-acetylglucosamine-6-phosphate deacetylase
MVELICDSQGIHVPPDLLGYVKAIKGVDKILLISDSFACDGEPPAGYAHVTDLSFNERGELSGSKLTMDVACRNWKMHTGASLVECFRVGSLNPSRALRMDHDIGSIAMGKKANLVVVNDEIQIQKVILEGDFIV